jgi:Fic family protein
LAAAVLAFGFVFIHPLVDGNGRLHRYLIHHVLIEKGFAPPNLLFPVSAVILAHLNDYRRVLESYSRPRLAHIEWTPTSDYNVAIHNETIDLYRYFDATQQAEFLYQRVKETVEQTIPEEVAYLEKYDRFKHYVENQFEMPNKMVALLVRFLEQGNGQLSERAVTHEFNALTKAEVALIEGWYEKLFR